MHFDVTERIQTKQAKNDVLNSLEAQFRKTSSKTTKKGDILVVETINPTFGSINRADVTTISLEQKDDGFFINAAVNYKTSVMFWIIFCLSIFTTIGWLIPIIFFFYQKKTVKTAIEEILNRTKNEFYASKAAKTSNSTDKIDGYAELEKLASLRDKGILNQEEFEERKKRIISNI